MKFLLCKKTQKEKINKNIIKQKNKILKNKTHFSLILSQCPVNI